MRTIQKPTRSSRPDHAKTSHFAAHIAKQDIVAYWNGRRVSLKKARRQDSEAYWLLSARTTLRSLLFQMATTKQARADRICRTINAVIK
jgi:hypothetical protein